MIRFFGRRRAGRADAGAAAVEAAILLPLFFLLVFGILEWGLYMRDSLAITESARVGVRTASALPRVENFTQTTVDAMARAGSAIPRSKIEFVYVYKANKQGFPGPDGNETMTCPSASCDKFVWNPATGAFALDPTSPPPPWNPKATIGTPGHVNACPSVKAGGPPDSVGVYVQAKHEWVTKFFGTSRQISDRAVLTFEPRQIATCK
ncbi:MAG: TadE/TadG family type IV pilus assembly protein [Candidatus Nanopelagicales bacterium]